MSLDRVGNQRIAHLAADIEPVADALARVLDPARCDHLAPVSAAQLRVLTLLRAQPALNVNGHTHNVDAERRREKTRRRGRRRFLPQANQNALQEIGIAREGQGNAARPLVRR